MTCGDEGVGVDEAADGGVVIAALEIIQPGIVVINIAAIAQRIQESDDPTGTRSVDDVAPSIVAIVTDHGTGRVPDLNHIALQIGDVIVGRAVQRHRGGIATAIIGKGQHIAPHRHLHQLGAVVQIRIGGSAVTPAGAHPVGIVGIGPGVGAIIHGRKLTAMFPGVGPCAVAERVAHLVVGNGHTIISRQQVAPCRILDKKLSILSIFAPSPLVFKSKTRGALCGCSWRIFAVILVADIAVDAYAPIIRPRE